MSAGRHRTALLCSRFGSCPRDNVPHPRKKVDRMASTLGVISFEKFVVNEQASTLARTTNVRRGTTCSTSSSIRGQIARRGEEEPSGTDFHGEDLHEKDDLSHPRTRPSANTCAHTTVQSIPTRQERHLTLNLAIKYRVSWAR